MCGILAFAGENTPKNRKLIEQLMLQLSLRGTHATGFAIQTRGPVEVFHAPLSAENFLQNFPVDFLLSDSKQPIRLIGHTRYSTSDLEWNQPLEREGTALVMNGVISQDFPHNWPGAELFDYQTGNDAEIGLMYALSGQRGHMPGSFAIAELDSGLLKCYRNTDRPLWMGCNSKEMFCVVASTRDALERCKVPNIYPIPPGKVYDIFPGGLVPEIDEELLKQRTSREKPIDVDFLLGKYEPDINDLLAIDEPAETFPVDELDQQTAELLYGDLKCLL